MFSRGCAAAAERGGEGVVSERTGLGQGGRPGQCHQLAKEQSAQPQVPAQVERRGPRPAPRWAGLCSGAREQGAVIQAGPGDRKGLPHPEAAEVIPGRVRATTQAQVPPRDARRTCSHTHTHTPYHTSTLTLRLAGLFLRLTRTSDLHIVVEGGAGWTPSPETPSRAPRDLCVPGQR